MDQLWEGKQETTPGLTRLIFILSATSCVVWGAEFLPVGVSRWGEGEGVKLIVMRGVSGQLALQRGQSINAARTPVASLQLST